MAAAIPCGENDDVPPDGGGDSSTRYWPVAGLSCGLGGIFGWHLHKKLGKKGRDESRRPCGMMRSFSASSNQSRIKKRQEELQMFSSISELSKEDWTLPPTESCDEVKVEPLNLEIFKLIDSEVYRGDVYSHRLPRSPLHFKMTPEGLPSITNGNYNTTPAIKVLDRGEVSSTKRTTSSETRSVTLPIHITNKAVQSLMVLSKSQEPTKPMGSVPEDYSYSHELGISQRRDQEAPPKMNNGRDDERLSQLFDLDTLISMDADTEASANASVGFLYTPRPGEVQRHMLESTLSGIRVDDKQIVVLVPSEGRRLKIRFHQKHFECLDKNRLVYRAIKATRIDIMKPSVVKGVRVTKLRDGSLALHFDGKR